MWNITCCQVCVKISVKTQRTDWLKLPDLTWSQNFALILFHLSSSLTKLHPRHNLNYLRSDVHFPQCLIVCGILWIIVLISRFNFSSINGKINTSTCLPFVFSVIRNEANMFFFIIKFSWRIKCFLQEAETQDSFLTGLSTEFWM